MTRQGRKQQHYQPAQTHKRVCFSIRNIRLVGEKQDDGFTGTNFECLGFHELLLTLQEGRADCVIVKDLSRLGKIILKLENILNVYSHSGASVLLPSMTA